MTNATERQAVVDGLRELAHFIETHPDMPVDLTQWQIQYSVIKNVFTSEDAGHGEVDRVAALLDVETTEPHGGRWYMATRKFGPIEYRAVYIREYSDEREVAA